jgi:alanine racemase
MKVSAMVTLSQPKEKKQNSYNSDWLCDGVSRFLSNKIYGIVNNKKVKQIGKITMDQMMFDVSDVEVKKGDIITLLSDEIKIDEWAKFANNQL